MRVRDGRPQPAARGGTNPCVSFRRLSRRRKDAPGRPGFLTRGSPLHVCLPKRRRPFGLRRLSDICDVSLAAYSGGTVWASHPLRVAAGANVKLSATPGALPDVPAEYSRVASIRCFLVTLVAFVRK